MQKVPKGTAYYSVVRGYVPQALRNGALKVRKNDVWGSLLITIFPSLFCLFLIHLLNSFVSEILTKCGKDGDGAKKRRWFQLFWFRFIFCFFAQIFLFLERFLPTFWMQTGWILVKKCRFRKKKHFLKSCYFFRFLMYFFAFFHQKLVIEFVFLRIQLFFLTPLRATVPCNGEVKSGSDSVLLHPSFSYDFQHGTVIHLCPF